MMRYTTEQIAAASFALGAAVTRARRQSGTIDTKVPRLRHSRSGRTTEQIRRDAWRAAQLVGAISGSGDGLVSIDADAPEWVESYMRAGMGCEACIFERAANPLHAAGTATWLVMASAARVSQIAGYDLLSERRGATFYRKTAAV